MNWTKLNNRNRLELVFTVETIELTADCSKSTDSLTDSYQNTFLIISKF